MKRIPNIRIALCFICIVPLSGCSIFGPVGHAISQGYENSVSYFNGYYNAKWLFGEAEEEIRLDNLSKRGKVLTPAMAKEIPGSTKEKFLKVIDKCSNILAFHPTSTLVDDALLLIGKSFYYQAEYLKAERKFAELLAQYPGSPLTLETQVWYARTENKLDKIEEGKRICESTINASHASGEDEIEAQAHQLLGGFYLKEKQLDLALAEFEKETGLAGDKDTKADVQIRIGDIYFTEQQFENAAKAYLLVGEYTSDIYQNFYSKLQTAVAYREMKEFKKGVTLLDNMIEDFRFKTYLPDLLFERANNYQASGKRQDALDEYAYIDTTYKTSEFSQRSAYQLGRIYENEIRDYSLALKYYSKINSATVPKSVADGRLKYAAFIRYFDAQKKLRTADSLLNLLYNASRDGRRDTLAMGVADTLNLPDSSGIAYSRSPLAIGEQKIKSVNNQLISARDDSLTQFQSMLDSTQAKISELLARHSRRSADSLATLKSLANTLKNKIANTTARQQSMVSDTLKDAPILQDSVFHPIRQRVDSLSMQKDSSRSRALLTTQRPPSISKDSLNELRSIAAQELGDIFYSEVVVPDSAFYWYNKSLMWKIHPFRSPRIIYILAELSRENPENKYPPPEEYYKRLDSEFSESSYAVEARRFLGKAAVSKKIDTAAVYYEQAGKQIDEKQYKAAVKTYRSIVHAYPQSPLAAKSDYAVGWIFENYLQLPESAFVQYRHVVKNYDGTSYAVAAANQIEVALQLEAARLDSLKMIADKLDSIKASAAKNDSINALSSSKSDSTKSNQIGLDTSNTKYVRDDGVRIKRARMDSLRLKNLYSDTLALKNLHSDSARSTIGKSDTSKIIPNPMNRKLLGPAGAKEDSIITRKPQLE